MPTKILAVSGRKFSGKSSLCNYIQAYLGAKDHNESYAGSPAGQGEGPLPFVRPLQSLSGDITWHGGDLRGREPHQWSLLSDEHIDFLKLDPRSLSEDYKVYNFADALKGLCIDILGLEPSQVWGTEQQKNSSTPFLWDNLPFSVRWNNSPTRTYGSEAIDDKLTDLDMLDWASGGSGDRFGGARSGTMTAREVLQVMGTDIMRKMFYNDVWVDSTLRAIRKERRKVAMIADLRFKGEFKAIHDAGGYVIRLERAIFNDTHASEVDLDGFDFRSYPRTLVIPADADIQTKNAMAVDFLESILKA